MVFWNKAKLEETLKISLPQEVEINDISIDTRTIKQNDLFIALRGNNFNGNQFASEAIEKGAALALVEEEDKADNKNIFYVENCLRALEKLAKKKRRSSNAKFIAITGSVGKTTTKEVLKKIFSDQKSTYASSGNFNNHIGVPLSLANMPEEVDYAIFELGMNHAGEISDLCQLVHPHLSAITWVSDAHIENFENMEGIARAKAEIVEWLVPDGFTVLPSDNDFFNLLEEISEDNGITNIYSFGLRSNEVLNNKGKIQVKIADEKLQINQDEIYKFTLNNLLLCLTIAKIYDLDMEKSLKSIKKVGIPEGRGQELVFANNITLIDDSYNANSESMKLALKKFSTKPSKGKKIAILGDMLELGEEAKQKHIELGQYITNVDMLITCGHLMENLHENALHGVDAIHFQNHHEIADFVKKNIADNDLILVKGSNGSKLHQVVKKLKTILA